MTTTQREHYRQEHTKARRRAERARWYGDMTAERIAEGEARRFRRLLEGGTA